MTDLTVGAKPPALKLSVSAEGGAITTDVPPRGSCVVFFFPRIGSSTCTNEVLAFASRRDAFAALGVSVLGVSPDPIAKLMRFCEKQGVSIPLAADPELEAAKAWGVWIEKQMYGRIFMGVERATFLLGRDGRIAASWRKVKLSGHVEAVLAAAQNLSSGR